MLFFFLSLATCLPVGRIVWLLDDSTPFECIGHGCKNRRHKQAIRPREKKMWNRLVVKTNLFPLCRMRLRWRSDESTLPLFYLFINFFAPSFCYGGQFQFDSESEGHSSLRRCYTRHFFLQLVSQFCCDISCTNRCLV